MKHIVGEILKSTSNAFFSQFSLIDYKRSRCRLRAAIIDTNIWFRRENCRFGAFYHDIAYGLKKYYNSSLERLLNSPAWHRLQNSNSKWLKTQKKKQNRYRKDVIEKFAKDIRSALINFSFSFSYLSWSIQFYSESSLLNSSCVWLLHLFKKGQQ